MNKKHCMYKYKCKVKERTTYGKCMIANICDHGEAYFAQTIASLYIIMAKILLVIMTFGQLRIYGYVVWMLDMIIEIGNPFQHKFSKQIKFQRIL